jgi:hypothetical protein
LGRSFPGGRAVWFGFIPDLRHDPPEPPGVIAKSGGDSYGRTVGNADPDRYANANADTITDANA